MIVYFVSEYFADKVTDAIKVAPAQYRRWNGYWTIGKDENITCSMCENDLSKEKKG